MLVALATLIFFQLAGEALRQILNLALPGPLIGMFLLAVMLVARNRGGAAMPAPLSTAANALIVNMGLLFVPAGVGIVAEAAVLRQAWLPLLAGLVVSTLLGLTVTGLVMHHVCRMADASSRRAPGGAAAQGARS